MCFQPKLITSCLILLSLLATGCFKSKTVVTRVPNGDGKSVPLNARRRPLTVDGVTYALPRTVIKVDVPVKRTVEAPGEFKEFAKCFFSDEVLNDQIKTKKKTYSIEPPTLSSRGEPDPVQHFIAKTKGGYFENKSMLLEYTAEGVLTKGEAESTNESFEFAVKAVKTIIGAAAKAGTPLTAAELLASPLTPKEKACQVDAQNTGPEKAATFQKALDVFNTMTKLQEKRDSLVSGQSRIDGLSPETLKLMLKELDDTIEAYKNSFLGTSAEKVWTGAFEFTPATPNPLPLNTAYGEVSPPLFWFSETDGLCPGTLALELGVQIPEKFKPQVDGEKCKDLSKMTPVIMRVDRQSQDDGFLGGLSAAHNADEARDRRGFYYRIPAKAVASLRLGTEGQMPRDLGLTRMVVAQYGIVTSLPASTSGRTTQYAIGLDDSTGALKNFKLGSNSLVQKSILEDAESSANAIIDAKKAREKAKLEASDVLAQKKRELELLKTQNEINAEKKKLETVTPGTP